MAIRSLSSLLSYPRSVLPLVVSEVYCTGAVVRSVSTVRCSKQAEGVSFRVFKETMGSLH